jgi:sulfite dehydrogenase (cytochrome) subunit B
MRQVRLPIGPLGLVALGLAVTVTTAEAQNQGPCRQIRLVCEGAGFTLGAARDGVGLAVHCISPIMQTRPQPPTARRPLPIVSPQLVADCKASNPNFGQLRPPQLTLALPTSPPSSRPAEANADPAPTGPPKPAPANDETSVHLKPAPVDKVETNCSACHSLDYIPMNSPFLNGTGWDAEVSKMITAFGAPIDPKDAEVIADYLKENYGLDH